MTQPFSASDLILDVRMAPIHFQRFDPHCGIVKDFTAQLLVRAELLGDDDPRRDAHRYAGFDTASHRDEEFVDVGVLTFSFIDRGAMLDEREDPQQVFDSHSADLFQLYLDLFDRDTDDLKPEVQDCLDDTTYPGSILYLAKLTVKPEFRGAQLGPAAVYTVLKQFRFAYDVAALYSMPIEFENPTDEQRDALAGMYADIGFLQVLGTENFMVQDRNLLQPGFPARALKR